MSSCLYILELLPVLEECHFLGMYKSMSFSFARVVLGLSVPFEMQALHIYFGVNIQTNDLAI